MNNNYTIEECQLWYKDKLINPKSKRKIAENSPLYNKINKLCSNYKEDIYSIFNNFCNTYKLKSTDIINSKDKKLYRLFNEFCDNIKKDDIKKDDINKDDKKKDDIKKDDKKKDDIKKDDIKKDDKKKDDKKKDDKKKDDISSSQSSQKDKTIVLNKFNDYKKIITYFKNINIKSKNCITLTSENNKYYLTDNIKLYQQIGTPSIFGIVYKAKNINESYKSIPKFVAKIQLQSKESKNELSIFKKISTYAFQNNIIHIPLYYFDTICDTIIREPAYPKLFQEAKKINKLYSISLYERAQGDLKSFIKSHDLNEYIWKNIYEQIFMSIFILHNLGYLHHDAHSGNFLYQTIKKGGCFHYKINNENYYIENLGILWMIWDFGNVIESKIYSRYLLLNDYYRINLSLCHRNMELEKNKNFQNNLLVLTNSDDIYGDISGFLDESIAIPSSIKNIQNKLWEKFVNTNESKYLTIKAQMKEINDKSFIKILKDEKLLFSSSPIGEVISSVTL